MEDAHVARIDSGLVLNRQFSAPGLNRHEAGNARVLRERSNEPLGPESLYIVRCTAKRNGHRVSLNI
jgi:hypothetical protein